MKTSRDFSVTNHPIRCPLLRMPGNNKRKKIAQKVCDSVSGHDGRCERG